MKMKMKMFALMPPSHLGLAPLTWVLLTSQFEFTLFPLFICSMSILLLHEHRGYDHSQEYTRTSLFFENKGELLWFFRTCTLAVALYFIDPFCNVY